MSIARALAVVVGMTGGLTVVVVGGFLALVTDCPDSSDSSRSMLCSDYSWLAGPLEWSLVGAGFIAALAGGIATCVSSRPRWLVAGLVAGAVLLGLVLAVTGQQASTLS